MIEFSRKVALAELGAAESNRRIAATDEERAALVARFSLRRLDRLEAELEVRRTGDGAALHGRFRAAGAQACVVSDTDVEFALDETLKLKFSRHAEPVGEEQELLESDLDTLPVEGEGIDLGEAVSQSLGVALDPYPRADERVLAAVRRRLLSEEEAAAERERERSRANPFRVIEGGGA